jgi:hypothetical protein
MNWTRIETGDTSTLPPEGVVVETKIDDHRGVRNEQSLVRQGGLMFFPDKSMYCYYWPTHWRYQQPTEQPQS